MITRQEALDLLHSKMQSVNLRRHCYSVEAAMIGLAEHFGEDREKWGLVGLLHDGDYEFTKSDPSKHAKLMADWVMELGETDDELLTGIKSHGWFHQGKLPETKLQWSLYCADELTGLIVAVTLVQPNRKIADTSLESIKKKWNQKAFAAGVDRSQIELCQEKLGIPLDKFIGIVLKSMQSVSDSLGL